jgi:hypothetical protein
VIAERLGERAEPKENQRRQFRPVRWHLPKAGPIAGGQLPATELGNPRRWMRDAPQDEVREFAFVRPI